MRFRLFSLVVILLLLPQTAFPAIESSEQDAASLRNTKEIDDRTVKRSESVSFVRPDGEILQEKIDSLQNELQGVQSVLKELDDRLRRVESRLEELAASRKKELPLLRMIGSSEESARDAR
jgi:peptidoglycan hydrolase CwlO-like protein